MKRNIKKMTWMLFSFAVFGSSAFAGAERGNGGNATVCYLDASRSKIKSIELFDYWEMNQVYSIPGGVTVSNPNAPVSQILNELMSRYARIDSENANAFLAESIRIAKNINYYLEDEIGVIEDDHERVHPTAPCYKEQYAVQLLNPLPNERRFVVNRKLYQSRFNNNLNRAGIILHEVIYRYAMNNYHHQNSDGARVLNYQIATNVMKSITGEQYETLLNSLSMPSGYQNYFVPELNTTFIGKLGKWQSFFIKRPQYIQNVAGISGEVQAGALLLWEGAPGASRLLELQNAGSLQLQLFGQEIALVKTISFGPQLSVIGFEAANQFQCKVSGFNYPCRNVELYPSRKIRKIELPAPFQIQLPNGNVKALKVGYLKPEDQSFNTFNLYFDENGMFAEMLRDERLDVLGVAPKIQFQLKGTQLFLNPFHVYLDSQGMMVMGDFEHSIAVQNYPGIDIAESDRFVRFTAAANGKVLISSLRFSVQKPKLQNLSLMAPGDGSGNSAACRSLVGIFDPANVTASGDILSEMKLIPLDVVGTKTFYDVIHSGPKSVTDDRVYVLSNVNCMESGVLVREENIVFPK